MSAYEMKSMASVEGKVSHAYDHGPQISRTGVRVSAMVSEDSIFC